MHVSRFGGIGEKSQAFAGSPEWILGQWGWARSRLGDSPSLSGGWESSCLWLPEDVALGFPIVGTESSRCLL